MLERICTKIVICLNTQLRVRWTTYTYPVNGIVGQQFVVPKISFFLMPRVENKELFNNWLAPKKEVKPIDW